MKVYAFFKLYCAQDGLGSSELVSLHNTRTGAEAAVKKHTDPHVNERIYNNRSEWDNIDCSYGTHGFCVEEMEIRD